MRKGSIESDDVWGVKNALKYREWDGCGSENVTRGRQWQQEVVFQRSGG